MLCQTENQPDTPVLLQKEPGLSAAWMNPGSHIPIANAVIIPFLPLY
jgi:hypothetical protein